MRSVGAAGTRARTAAVNISAPFIRRPVMTTMVMSALIVFGIAAYFTLPVSELPNVDFPTISVSANLPGADPQTMAAAVATPLERQFSAIPGVTSMDSASTTGSTRITLQFDLDRNIDAAAQDVQTAISQSVRRLPDNMPSPPSLRKVNPADFAIIYLALSANQLPLTQLDEYAETRVAQQISTIPGVAQVLVFGSHKYAVRLRMNPYALAARNLSLAQVQQAIQGGNSNLPTGTLNGSARSYTVQADGPVAGRRRLQPPGDRLSQRRAGASRPTWARPRTAPSRTSSSPPSSTTRPRRRGCVRPSCWR